MSDCTMCEISQRFHDVAVKERDYERVRGDRLEKQVLELEKALEAAHTELKRGRVLLKNAREYLHGCEGLDDEVCECEFCEYTTDLLITIDGYIEKNEPEKMKATRRKIKRGTDETGGR